VSTLGTCPGDVGYIASHVSELKSTNPKQRYG